jgi:Putative serine esterase (DUF676)
MVDVQPRQWSRLATIFLLVSRTIVRASTYAGLFPTSPRLDPLRRRHRRCSSYIRADLRRGGDRSTDTNFDHKASQSFELTPTPTIFESLLSSTSTSNLKENMSTLLFPTLSQTLLLEQIRNRKLEGRSTPTIINVHCIVLVHGWMGNAKELSYLQSQLIQQGADVGCCFLVHSSTVNEGRTSDGIAAGGQRLADEINQLMEHVQHELDTDLKREQQPLQKSSSTDSLPYQISLSFIGNSLGGLYARYALRHIPFLQPNNTSINIYPAVFCTTCTPHLGVGTNQTFIALPVWIQTIFASIIGRTGYDLFRIPSQFRSTSDATIPTTMDIIQEMTFGTEYREPLQKFHRRIALCNTHQTDLQVPCATAAFLVSPDSFSTPTENTTKNNDETVYATRMNYYYLSEWNDKVLEATEKRSSSTTRLSPTHKNCMSLIVETTTSQLETKEPSSGTSHSVRTTNEFVYQLDTMGWMKIFCDTRPYLPCIQVPTISNVMTTALHWAYYLSYFFQRLFNRTLFSEPTHETNPSPAVTSTESTLRNTSIKSEYSTQDIWDMYIEGKDDTSGDDTPTKNSRWYFPLGHALVVANAKNEWYGTINAAGKPTMDQLATIIIHEILQSSTANRSKVL